MKFRPCIDIHNGQVKQIVGGSLQDKGSMAATNYVATQDAAFYAALYREHHLTGGHIILLNPEGSEYYEQDVKQAEGALREYPQGLQVGGGIHADNAESFLERGASHVIVTSYVFQQGRIQMENLERLVRTIGKDKLVLDLSCRYQKAVEDQEAGYYIVTDRWQRYTEHILSKELLTELAEYCDEFLVHAVDVEGKQSGIDSTLAEILGGFSQRPITYAGGIHSWEDIQTLKQATGGCVDFTIGSALDLFGGCLPFKELINEGAF